MYRRPTRCHLLASAAALALIAVPMLTDAAETGSNQLDEIIVTAQKRTEDVNKVPTSISVVGGDALGAGGIQDYDDLTRAVPGISFAAGGAGNGVGEGNTILEFRGVSSAGAEATVGIYSDEMSVTNSNRYVGATQPLALDIARVEVLRGPQGTLYGASSEGGTIRYIHNKPDLDKVSGFVAGDVSDTDHGGINYQTSGVINVPIINDKLAVRLGALYGGDSGWIDHYDGNGDLVKKGINSTLTKGARFDALYQPNDGFSVELQTNYQDVIAKDEPTFYLGSDTVISPPYSTIGGLFKQSKPVKEGTHDTVLSTSLDIVKDLGFAELTSVTSHYWRAMEMITDATYYDNNALVSFYLPLPPSGVPSRQISVLPDQESYPVEFQTINQEVRLASPPASTLPFKWVGGLYFSRQKQSYLNDEPDPLLPAVFQQVYGYPISQIDTAVGAPANAGNAYWSNVYSQATHTWTYQYAAFGQVEYDITQSLHLTGGLRYQFSRQFYSADQSDFYSIGIPAHVGTSSDYFAATPKFSLSYDLDDASSVYGTAAKGFRIGGPTGPLPTGAGNVCSQDYANLNLVNPPSIFGQDSLWSYEAGVKSTFADRTISINADGYYINWNKIQQGINLPICGYFYTTNVGNAESYGGEIELHYAPPFVKGLKLGLTGSVTKANLTAVTVPFAEVGQSVLYVPLQAGTVSVDYNFALNNDLSAFVHADYDFTGHSHGAFQNYNPNYEDLAYGVMNASLGVDSGSWKVSLYAKNLLNDHTIIQSPQVNSLIEGYTVRPMTIGISGRKDF